MQKMIKFLSVIVLVAIGFTACEKVNPLPIYEAGSGFSAAVSTNAVAAIPADSNKVALTVSWNFPKYSVDSNTAKYVVEIDSTGKNFTKAVVKTITGKTNTTYTAKELNAILLNSFGYTIGKTYGMDIRVTASHANNNEQLKSAVLKVTMVPYKVPPKIALPTSGKLFLVGDASQGGWNNPVPTPTQEFARLDETTFAGVFNLNGGKQYLVLPVNGDWSNKFSVANNTLAGLSAGGDFGFNLNDNFPGPAASGNYLITLDFQTGKFTAVAFTQQLPANLFMVGDATPGGWNNPVPVPSQQFTRVNSVQFELTTPINGGKEFLMLPVNGDWSHKFAVANKGLAGLSAGGTFGYDLNDNLPAPTASGTYKYVVNFATYKFTATLQ